MKESELFKIVEVKIPNTDLVIKIKTEFSWFEQLECVKIKDELERAKYMLCKLIVNWNLENDEDKQPLPVTKEVIERLPSSVAVPLAHSIEKIAKIKILKKNNLLRT